MVRQMRVVGGRAKGIRLKGAVSAGTRSTTERVRAAIFNILHGELYQEGSVLDLFAGCGGLGIEALSRGAAWADFVESNARSGRRLRDTLRELALNGGSRVYLGKVERTLESLSKAYDLIFADPPYDMVAWDWLMERLSDLGLVSAHGSVVLEHRQDTDLRHQYGRLARVTARRYGDTGVTVYAPGAADG